MRNHLFHTRMAAVLIAAAVFLSGCHHWMSPRKWMPSHSRMDRIYRSDRSAAKSSWRVSKADRPGYTVAMVAKALRIYDAKGREATVAFYNSPQSVDGEWYVFIADENNDIIAHPNPDVVGANLLDETGVDITGYRHGEVIAGATEEGKWVDYIYLNRNY